MNIEPVDEAELIVPENERQLPALREPQQPPSTTAAQAKTDAVSALTLSAYQKASQLALTDEEVAALLADFPDEAFKTGAAGKENLLYLEHAYLRDRLNSVFRPGQWAIIPRSRWAEAFRTKPSRDNPQGLEASRVYVEAMLCIRGCFAAEAVGEMEYYPHNAGQNYGDAVEGAKTAALRRCAKELGIGLQAWKKDWCLGWWQRKNNPMRPQNAPPAPIVPVSSPPKPKTAPPPPQAPKMPPVASQTHPADLPKRRTPAEEKEHIALLEAWLAKCKGELLVRIGPVMQGANEYAAKAGLILPNETLEAVSVGKLFKSVDWNLSRAQNQAAVKQDFEKLVAAIQSFIDGDQIPGAEVPEPVISTYGISFPADFPHPDPDPEATAREKAKEEWFWDLIIPVPRKGMKRDEYLKAPDTIRSLYEQRHGNDEDSKIARERLWGFVNHYQPTGWKKKDGTQMPPSESDKKFRSALDSLAEWLEKKGETI